MSNLLQRLADRARRIGASAPVAAVGRALRSFLEHPAWQRLGCAILARIPAGPAARLKALHDGHPGLFRAVAACFVLVVLAMLWVSHDYMRESHPGARSLPDFRVIKDIDERKEAFIEFMQPVIAHENARVREQRGKLLAIRERLEAGETIAAHEHAWLVDMADRYRVDAEDDRARARALSTRIDIVPDSLALAQAALESAWGTSRFAREGNNLFGQWCFEPGCGIVPRRRAEGKTHEVQAFDTIAGSVRTYLRNLDSHPSYRPLREIRAEARRAGREPDGEEMAAGLVNYAAIGEEYVRHIRGVIRRNELERVALRD